jgi:hypothetical protein
MGRQIYTELWLGNLGKWPLGRARKRWKDNIEMDLKVVGYENGRWMAYYAV